VSSPGVPFSLDLKRPGQPEPPRAIPFVAHLTRVPEPINSFGHRVEDGSVQRTRSTTASVSARRRGVPSTHPPSGALNLPTSLDVTVTHHSAPRPGGVLWLETANRVQRIFREWINESLRSLRQPPSEKLELGPPGRNGENLDCSVPLLFNHRKKPSRAEDGHDDRRTRL